MPSRAYYEALWEALPGGTRADPTSAAAGASCWSACAAGERVLDVGCGEGRFAAELARAGAQVWRVDVAEEPLRRARARHPELDLRLVDARRRVGARRTRASTWCGPAR